MPPIPAPPEQNVTAPVVDASGVKPAASMEEQEALLNDETVLPPVVAQGNLRPDKIQPLNHSQVALPKPNLGHKPIEVEAIAKGMWQQRRMMPGDRFFVPRMDKVGNWMKCVDPDLEKEHQALMKQRKQAEREKLKLDGIF